MHLFSLFYKKISCLLVGGVLMLTSSPFQGLDLNSSYAQSASSIPSLYKDHAPFKNVLMYGGMSQPFDQLGAVSTFLRDTPLGLMDFKMMVSSLLQKQFHMKSLDGVDLKQNLNFAVFTQGSGKKTTQALILKMTDPKTFNASIPQTPTELRGKENQLYYHSPQDQRPTYVNFIDSYVVFTSHINTFKKNREFLKTLATHSFKESGVIHFDFDHLKTHFKDEIAHFKQELTAHINQSNQPVSKQFDQKSLLKFIQLLFSKSGHDLAEGILILKMTDLGMQLDFRLRAKPKSQWALFLKDLNGKWRVACLTK